MIYVAFIPVIERYCSPSVILNAFVMLQQDVAVARTNGAVRTRLVVKCETIETVVGRRTMIMDTIQTQSACTTCKGSVTGETTVRFRITPCRLGKWNCASFTWWTAARNGRSVSICIRTFLASSSILVWSVIRVTIANFHTSLWASR